MIRLETPRLILREFVQEDHEALFEILSDPETMKHYPRPYDAAGVQRWLDWSFAAYRDFGFGLWAAVFKETGQLIGDCGVTMQPIGGWIRPEIGYHIHKAYWRQGLGSEAARAVRDWAFTHSPFQTLYSYMAGSNEASRATARMICRSGKPFCSCMYFSTEGSTAQEPQVGAVTMVPQSAFCSLAAKA